MMTSVYLNVSAWNPETLVLSEFLFGIPLMFQGYLRDDLFRYPETASLRDGIRNRLGSKTAYRVGRCIVILLFASPATLSVLHRLQQLLKHRCLKLLGGIDQFGLLLLFNRSR